MLLKNSLTDKQQQHFVKYSKLYLSSFHLFLLLFLQNCYDEFLMLIKIKLSNYFLQYNVLLNMLIYY